MEKVIVELEPEAWHGHSTESMWATRLNDGFYKIENSPFFALGISFEDIVEVQQREGLKYIKRTIVPSGRSTYRIILNKDTSVAQFEKLWKPLEKEGCTYEHGRFGYDIYSVDVPKNTDVQKIFTFLEGGELQAIWTFEEGHFGHAFQCN